MRAHGFNLGGEQSGHIVLADYATTGDGLIAALQLLAVLVRSERPASEACRPFRPLPQKLKSCRGDGALLDRPEVERAIRAAEAALKGHGRLLVRKSGTEPVLRVMAEGEDEALVGRVVDDIVAAMERAAG